MAFLSEILDDHKQKYNAMTIKDNYDLIKREEFLYSIESYYKYRNLDDKELRKKLYDIGLNIRLTADEMESKSEEYFALTCRIEYWHELTDAIKTVEISAESE